MRALILSRVPFPLRVCYGPAVDVKLIQTPEAFELAEWQTLLEADPHRHIFLTPEWNRVWWEEFGAGKDLYVLVFYDPEPVGLAGLMADNTASGRRFRFLGGDDLTDYLGPLSLDHEHLPAIAGSLLDFMKEEIDDWDYFDAKCLPVPFHFAEWLAEAADRLHMDFTIDQDEMTAVLLLPSSTDEYFDSLGRKERHELRRKLRRFESEAPESSLTSVTKQSLSVDLTTFAEMHRTSGGLKGKFMLPARASFFTRLAQVFEPKGMLSLDFLETQERRVATTFSFRFDQHFYLYNSAYLPEAKRLSPGLILVYQLIVRAIEQGFQKFDFLRGHERYKFDLGAQPVPLHTLTIERNN